MPDPRVFEIQTLLGYPNAVVAKIRYPNCTTFEGTKILVFTGVTVDQVREAGVLDPHFSDKAPRGAVVPIARFEPTALGWRLAMDCAASL